MTGFEDTVINRVFYEFLDTYEPESEAVGHLRDFGLLIPVFEGTNSVDEEDPRDLLWLRPHRPFQSAAALQYLTVGDGDRQTDAHAAVIGTGVFCE